MALLDCDNNEEEKFCSCVLGLGYDLRALFLSDSCDIEMWLFLSSSLEPNTCSFSLLADGH